MLAGFKSRCTIPPHALGEHLGDFADSDEDLLLGLRHGRMNEVRERSPFDIRHRDVMRAVDLAHIVNRADPRMPQRGGGSRLAIETLEQLGLGIFRQLRSLEGDFSFELRVLAR